MNLSQNFKYPFYILSVFFFSSCVSTTLITSVPEKAEVRIDGVVVGETPYRHSDAKVVTSTTNLYISKEGYKPINTYISKDEQIKPGPAIAGFFFFIPWLWSMEYRSSYIYDLKPLKPETPTIENTGSESPAEEDSVTKMARQLRELKALLDDGIITQEEFDAKKKSLLENEF